MRFAVTGATGFVGEAVCRRLLAEGRKVHAFVRDTAAAAGLAEAGARIHAGTLADPNELADAAAGCEVVVHAAAIATHRAARVALDWVNVAGTENVLRAARHAGCRRVVHISCADVTLANIDRVHWNEDRHLDRPPVGHHARSKQLAEELVLSSSGPRLETTALRPTILWGPGDRTMLPALCREGLSGGVRLPGGGGHLVSATYIDHLVDAVLAAATAEGAAGRAYLVDDGELMTAAELFGALCRAAELPPPRGGLPYGAAYALAWLRERIGARGPWRPDVIRRGRAAQFDCARVVHELGCRPHVGLEEGARRLAAWVREQGGAEAVARLERPPARDQDVAEHIALAHGEES